MSYDISLEIDTGGPEPATICDIGNYTSNVSAMWRRAIGMSLSQLHGMTCKDAETILGPAVAHISDPANAAEYMAMNPKNGWGDHHGAKCYLNDLLDGCRRHPKATISISC